MTLWQLLTILRARWRRILLVWLAFVLVGVGLTLVWPKSYTADTDIVIDVKSPDPLGGVTLTAALPSFMQTEIDVIESRRVGERVIDILKLDTDPKVLSQWKEATDGAGDVRLWLFQAMSRGLIIRPTRDSNLLTINYKASDPVVAATMANAYAQAYVDVSMQLRMSPASQNASWFKEQLATLSKNVDEAQTRLTDFRREKGLIGDTQRRIDAETTNLNDLALQLSAAQGQNAESRSKRAPVGDLSTLPEVMQNPLVQSLRVDLAGARSSLQEVSTRLGPNHPEYRRLSAQVASLEGQLSAQISRVAASIVVTDNQGSRRTENLEEALKTQKAKVIEMNADMDRMRTLENQLLLAEKALQGVSDRYLQTDLQGQLASTNIRLLSPAKPPLRPSSPKTVLAVALSLFLGVVFGLGSALVAELLDRRIRSPADFDAGFGMPLPLLGVVPAIETGSKATKRQALARKSSVESLTHQA